MSKEFYTFTEAREILGIGRKAFEGLLKREELKRVGNKISRAELEKVLGHPIETTTTSDTPDDSVNKDKLKELSDAELELKLAVVKQGIASVPLYFKKKEELDNREYEVAMSEGKMKQDKQTSKLTCDNMINDAKKRVSDMINQAGVKARDIIFQSENKLKDIELKIVQSNERLKNIQLETDKIIQDAKDKASFIKSNAEFEYEVKIKQADKYISEAKSREENTRRLENTKQELQNWINEYLPVCSKLIKMLSEINYKVKENTIFYGGSLNGDDIKDRAYFFWKDRFDEIQKLTLKLSLKFLKTIEKPKKDISDNDLLSQPVQSYDEIMRGT